MNADHSQRIKGKSLLLRELVLELKKCDKDSAESRKIKTRMTELENSIDQKTKELCEEYEYRGLKCEQLKI